MTTTTPILGFTKDEPPNKPPKPALYKLYDYTMGGTDRVDQVPVGQFLYPWMFSYICLTQLTTCLLDHGVYVNQNQEQKVVHKHNLLYAGCYAGELRYYIPTKSGNLCPISIYILYHRIRFWCNYLILFQYCSCNNGI